MDPGILKPHICKKGWERLNYYGIQEPPPLMYRAYVVVDCKFLLLEHKRLWCRPDVGLLYVYLNETKFWVVYEFCMIF
jgi:hypothetical protein